LFFFAHPTPIPLPLRFFVISDVIGPSQKSATPPRAKMSSLSFREGVSIPPVFPPKPSFLRHPSPFRFQFPLGMRLPSPPPRCFFLPSFSCVSFPFLRGPFNSPELTTSNTAHCMFHCPSSLCRNHLFFTLDDRSEFSPRRVVGQPLFHIPQVFTLLFFTIPVFSPPLLLKLLRVRAAPFRPDVPFPPCSSVNGITTPPFFLRIILIPVAPSHPPRHPLGASSPLSSWKMTPLLGFPCPLMINRRRVCIFFPPSFLFLSPPLIFLNLVWVLSNAFPRTSPPRSRARSELQDSQRFWS